MGVKETTSNTGTDYCLSRLPCLSRLILNMVLHNLINNFRIQVFINVLEICFVSMHLLKSLRPRQRYVSFQGV